MRAKYAGQNKMFFDKIKDKLLNCLIPKPDIVTPWVGGSINNESIPLERAYCIEILNYDHTPMDFVIFVLMSHCKMDEESALKKMLEIHDNGFAKFEHSSQSIMENFAAHLNTEALRLEHPLFVRAVLK